MTLSSSAAPAMVTPAHNASRPAPLINSTTASTAVKIQKVRGAPAVLTSSSTRTSQWWSITRSWVPRATDWSKSWRPELCDRTNARSTPNGTKTTKPAMPQRVRVLVRRESGGSDLESRLGREVAAKPRCRRNLIGCSYPSAMGFNPLATPPSTVAVAGSHRRVRIRATASKGQARDEHQHPQPHPHRGTREAHGDWLGRRNGGASRAHCPRGDLPVDRLGGTHARHGAQQQGGRPERRPSEPGAQALRLDRVVAARHRLCGLRAVAHQRGVLRRHWRR